MAFEELRRCLASLDRGCSLRQLASAAARVADRITQLFAIATDADGDADGEFRLTLTFLRRAADGAAAAAREQLRQISILTRRCRDFATMDFRFLYHRDRRLLAIGYNVSQRRRDDSYYGMLASEARLASFLAVSHGQLPLEHWFALGRRITLANGKPALLSWSGSMFEYLMPMLLMPTFRKTLLDVSRRRAVRRQIRYARQRAVPWGISESCCGLTDETSAYRYSAFGTPGLGLMRGLGDRFVVAPYASALASMVAPTEAWKNLVRLERSGYLSPYGFYDAIDYSLVGDPPNSEPTPCRTVMAHHSGMTLLALAHVLLNAPMTQRFTKTRLHAAYEVLLQERLPQAVQPAPASLSRWSIAPGWQTLPPRIK